MAVRDELSAIDARKDIDARQKRRLKHERKAIAAADAAKTRLPLTMKVGRWNIAVQSVTRAGREVRCRVEAMQGGKPVAGFDGDLRFVNPPTLVGDSAGDIVVEEGVSPILGTVTPERRYREDVWEALRLCIIEEVERQAAKLDRVRG